MIFISEQAKNKLISLLKKEEKENHQLSFFVRFEIKNSGCSGMSYQISFEKKVQKEDQIFQNKGIKILVDKKSLPYLKGTILEYSDGLKGKGFYFKNPNAKHTCGCGKSFSL